MINYKYDRLLCSICLCDRLTQANIFLTQANKFKISCHTFQTSVNKQLRTSAKQQLITTTTNNAILRIQIEATLEWLETTCLIYIST